MTEYHTIKKLITKISTLDHSHHYDIFNILCRYNMTYSKKYKKIIVIGHSEGSLIGILASKSIADGFISIAGAGEDYLTLIQRQLSDRAPYIKSMSDPIIEQLKKNKLVDSVPSLLNNLFGNNVQRFLIDASSYDPAVEISKLDFNSYFQIWKEK